MGKYVRKYRELASVRLKQPYYSNALCKAYLVAPKLDFEIIPSDECWETLERLGLVFRVAEREAGFVVLGWVSGKVGGNDLLRCPSQSTDKLTFWLKLRNPDCQNFNELPITHQEQKLLYLSNHQQDALAPRDQLHLSKNAAGIDPTTDLVECSSTIFRHHYNAPVTPGSAKIKHSASGITLLPSDVINENGQADLVFDLATLPLGICKLVINNVTVKKFYHLGAPGFLPFAVIEMSLSASLLTNYRVIEPNHSLAAIRPQYEALFKNRKVYWRYTLHLPANSPLSLEMAELDPIAKADFLDHLNIVSNDTAVTFKRVSTTAADIVFVSNNTLALQEKYLSSSSATHDPLNLSLKKYIGVGGKEAVVKSGLPYPQVKLIDATAYPDIYSDTLITL